jgi:hypothetical protein
MTFFLWQVPELEEGFATAPNFNFLLDKVDAGQRLLGKAHAIPMIIGKRGWFCDLFLWAFLSYYVSLPLTQLSGPVTMTLISRREPSLTAEVKSLMEVWNPSACSFPIGLFEVYRLTIPSSVPVCHADFVQVAPCLR